MNIEHFRKAYGEKFYAFINSELGAAMLLVLQATDPATDAATMPAVDQTANSTLYLGQITGWRACIVAMQTKLIVAPGGAAHDVEATYEREDDDDLPGGGPAAGPVQLPTQIQAPAARAKRAPKKPK